jgi:uncharacterized cupin superfamily protein
MTEAAGTDVSYMQTYPSSDGTFEKFDLAPENILEGDPQFEVATYYQSPDGSVLVGASQSADEINYVTTGRMIITSDRDDQQLVCMPGSVTRLDRGVVYTKTVVEPYEETFVMFNDAGVQM